MAWKITPKMLKDAGACEDDYKVFCREFPKGMSVTKKNLRIARSVGLRCVDWKWAAYHLFGEEAGEYCQGATEEFDCVEDCNTCEAFIDAFYATVKKFRSV